MAKNKKPLNLDNLPSLNLESGMQYSSGNKQFFNDNPELGKFASKLTKIQGTPGDIGSYIPRFFGEMLLRNPNSFRGEYTTDKGTQSFGYKKGGKIKAKKPKDGRMKKAKCRDGIAQRGKTRGKVR
tara:strand:- start:560 stop:937 length:378 start_codon:yes stop_codon:yes gene_type:complete